MHRSFWFVSLLSCVFAVDSLGAAAALTVGGGAPTPQISYDFQLAFYRGNFQNLVSLPPLTDVMALGTTGLVQEFSGTTTTTTASGGTTTATARFALVLPNKAVSGYANDIYQLLSDVYGYYSTVGATAAGYPTMDSQSCPGVSNCSYDFFTNNYALFVFTSGNPNGTNFSVSGNYYIKWMALGGLTGPLGLVYTAQKTVTSPTAVTAGAQTFNGGSIFSITSGINSGQTFAVLGSIDTLYESQGGPTGVLGLPLADQTTSNGVITQSFEAGKIQVPTGGSATILYPVAQVNLTPAGPITLAYGQSITVNEVGFDTNGYTALNRLVSWSSSNGQVVTITPSNTTAVLHAVGGGTAIITASSEGKVSLPLVVTVTSTCCLVGDGAPSAVQQAFQTAVLRNRVAVQLPGPNAAKRVGGGYTQDLIATDGVTHYLVAESDASGTAYVVAGAQLAAYNSLGGVSGTLGYPVSDVSAGGTQLFTNNAALAGSPAQLVSGPIFTKWALLNYETGVAGPPTAPAVPFTSQSEYAGMSQAFAGGAIYGIANSNLAGKAFFVSGLILTKYLAAGGPAGELGVPLSDQFPTATDMRQTFENGYIAFTPGAAAAQENLAPRVPAVNTNPASALSGTRLHLTISGFANGATIRVSVTGQPDFVVTTPNGSYAWDVYISPSAPSATITVKAADTSSGTTATGSYSVRSLADAHPQLKKAQGDNQTGTPGAVLTLPLVVLVTDNAGIPIPNLPVSFTASPGAQALPASAVTDTAGRASASFRLPSTAGVAAITARAAGLVVIFDAEAIGSPAISSFPQFSQSSLAASLGNGSATGAQKGALVTAAAAVLRYYQNQGVLPAANGLADPNTLNGYLKSTCIGVANGAKSCDGFLTGTDTGEQVVNLWRLVNFAGGGLTVSVETPDQTVIVPLVSSGDPVLLNLALTEDGVAAGGTTVVATGIANDGSLLISDPNPAFAQPDLNYYLGGFTAGGHAWKGTLLSAVRLLPHAPSAAGFLLEAISQPVAAFPALSAVSAAGPCSSPLAIQDAAVFGTAPPTAVRQSEFVYCDGSQPLYQVTVGEAQSYHAAITDLAPAGATQDLSGSTPAAYQVTRTGGAFTVSAPHTSFTTASVVNAASFAAAVAPGELISIFGSGLSGPGAATAVTVNGAAAQLLLSSPFQINAVVPAGLAPGTYSLTIASPFGSVSQSVVVQAAAPGIFILATNADGTVLGAVVNQDGTVNGPANPLARGKVLTIYGTGLGAVKASGSLSTTVSTVQAVLGGNPLPVAFAGLTPGFVGLYQVNVAVPLATPPGLSLPLLLQEGGVSGNTISVAIQ